MGLQPKFFGPKSKSLKPIPSPHLNLGLRENLNLVNTKPWMWSKPYLSTSSLFAAEKATWAWPEQLRAPRNQYPETATKSLLLGLKAQCWAIWHTCQLTKRANKKGSSSPSLWGSTMMISRFFGPNYFSYRIELNRSIHWRQRMLQD